MDNYPASQDLSDDYIYNKVSEIISKFNLLQCDTCSKAIIRWLKDNQIKGKLLRLRTKNYEDYIISKRLEKKGINDSITYNGIHYGVEVREKVFDNLSSGGMTKEDWVNDFQCFTEEFIVDEIENF